MSKKTHLRYRALISLIYISGQRISDIIKIKKEQFNFKEEKDFVIIKNVIISNRRNDQLLLDIPLPLVGKMKPFSEIIIQHYKKRRGKEYLFSLTRNASYKAIKKVTGKWCDYFRFQCFNYSINNLGNVAAVARNKGVDVSTIMHYYSGSKKQHQEDFKSLDRKKCFSCGILNSAEAKHCNNCGFALDEVEAKNILAKKKIEAKIVELAKEMFKELEENKKLDKKISDP